jgi:hypothetical protein
MSAVMARSPRVSRAERVAANRADIEGLLAERGIATSLAPRLPEPVGPRGTRPLEYVGIGQCRTCKLTWRTNVTGGEVKRHGPKGKPCSGSYKPPLRHTVVVKDLYVPGERWPKGRV